MIDRSFDNNCTPQYFFDKITDITPAQLNKMGVKAVALDIDNTTAYDSIMTLLSGVEKWVSDTAKAGFPLIIISNTYTLRAKHIAKKLGGIPYIANSKKPDPKNIIRAAKMLDVKVGEMCLIGDQLFTDIRGANDAGAISVRVRPQRTEYLFFIRYKILRKQEHDYLKLKGYGDKI